MFITKGSGKTPRRAFGEKGEIMYQSGRLELAAVTNHPESQCLVRSQLIFQLHPVSWLLYTGYIIQCPSSLQDPNSEGSAICHIEGVREKSKKNCGDHSLTLQCCPGLRVEVDHLNSAEFNKAGNSIQTTWSNRTSFL